MTEENKDLAAEFALGLLTGDRLRAARDLLASDPAFQAEVGRWAGRFAPLLDELEPVMAPRASWTAIQQRLDADSPGGEVVDLARSMKRWRAAAAAMTAIAASLALFILARPGLPAPQPATRTGSSNAAPMLATLGDPHGATKVVASWSPTERKLVLVVSGKLAADPGSTHELWVIPAGGKPQSLGTMGSDKQIRMQLANKLAALLQNGSTIAISIEPTGGSPTGAPTGPVVASGALSSA